MDSNTIGELKDFYYTELIEDVVPFWERNSVDHEYGGFMDFLDREGKPLSTDKGGWVQGRAVWIFSTLYKEIEPKKEWLEAAEKGVRFIREHLIRKEDGRVYFEVTREGKPLVMRRYLFSEMFAAIGLAAYSEVSGDRAALAEAKKLYALIDNLEGKLEPKIDPATREFRGHSMTMMQISLNQIMRQADPESAGKYTARIDRQIDELFRYFVKPDLKALLETVGPEGEMSEGPEGRCVNPGHAIETAWFILEEAKYRNDKDLMEKTLPILQWSLDLGWDKEYGGLFSFVDIGGKQPAQIEWDMKYWWPHCETIYALLLAYEMTGRDVYEQWFKKVHDYTWSHFPDREKGEWFGYLRRDGSVQVDLKGNHYKGPFHIPRFLMKTYKLLEEMAK
ncbi:AGE family epimerase/isomerase [Spirochaeta isovalerica]|uniref:N-acylglucosamine 2-epimerase n=1 Tax=Spirochaeta isovalerica TaxID=150 RepID=A0A841R9D1_9SPIO|nr:AGE family epimerase/isomerase [Spirochaeta isovalerica]MBB6479971.1 N-acylglucosamine 2-epimerase [Spirochaeta isovalerica]